MPLDGSRATLVGLHSWSVHCPGLPPWWVLLRPGLAWWLDCMLRWGPCAHRLGRRDVATTGLLLRTVCLRSFCRVRCVCVAGSGCFLFLTRLACHVLVRLGQSAWSTLFQCRVCILRCCAPCPAGGRGKRTRDGSGGFPLACCRYETRQRAEFACRQEVQAVSRRVSMACKACERGGS